MKNETKRLFTVGPNKNQFEIVDMEQVILSKMDNGEFSITEDEANKKMQKYIKKGGLWKVCLCASGKPHFFQTEQECIDWAIDLTKRTSSSSDHTVNFLN